MWMWDGKDWSSETEIKRVTNQTKQEKVDERERKRKPQEQTLLDGRILR